MARIRAVDPDLPGDITVLEGVDFAEIERQAEELKPDLVIGSSKGYGLARRMKIPLIRVGFPIHDRIDGPRWFTWGIEGRSSCSIASPTP